MTSAVRSTAVLARLTQFEHAYLVADLGPEPGLGVTGKNLRVLLLPRDPRLDPGARTDGISEQPPTGREGDRHRAPSAEGGPVGVLDEAILNEAVVGHPPEDLSQHLLEHPAGEVGSGAAVDTHAEGHVPVGESVDEELVSVREG